jgi:hypothetical protein
MSVTTSGIIAMIVGPFLVKFGFSDACSGEITSIVLPALAALPGAIMAQIGRYRLGGITWYGART